MTTLQNAKLEMYMALVSLLGNARAAWAPSRAFTQTFLEFLQYVNAIQGDRQKLESLERDRQTVDRELAYRLSLPEEGERSHGYSDSSDRSYRICHVTTVSEVEKLVRARSILKEATRLAGQLESNPLNGERLARFKAAITEFTGLIFNSLKIHPEILTLEAGLAQRFEEVDDLLQRRMDPQVDQFRLTQPGFYADYQETRVLPLSPAMIS